MNVCALDCARSQNRDTTQAALVGSGAVPESRTLEPYLRAVPSGWSRTWKPYLRAVPPRHAHAQRPRLAVVRLGRAARKSARKQTALACDGKRAKRQPRRRSGAPSARRKAGAGKKQLHRAQKQLAEGGRGGKGAGRAQERRSSGRRKKVASGCEGAVENTRLCAERGRAHKPRKRRSRFVGGICNVGVAAASARARVQPLARCGPAPWGRRRTRDLMREATARAFSSPPLLLREFFFGGRVGRVVHERLRALEPAVGGD